MKVRHIHIMEIIKIIGIGLISLIMIIIIKQHRPEFAIYISVIAGVLIFSLIFGKISGIITMLSNLASKSSINMEFLNLLIKITGISLLTEFAVSICKDSGESAIASKIDIGGKVTIIAISIPIISSLLETVIKVLP